MSEQLAVNAANAADEIEEDDEPGVRYASTSHPGMVAVRRRRGRRRRRVSSADVRARQIRIGLLVLIVGLLIFQVTGHSIHALTRGMMAQIFRPFYMLVLNLHLEVVALLIAAAVLIYLTPGVEDNVLRVFGIKRTTKGRR